MFISKFAVLEKSVTKNSCFDPVLTPFFLSFLTLFLLYQTEASSKTGGLTIFSIGVEDGGGVATVACNAGSPQGNGGPNGIPGSNRKSSAACFLQ